MNQKNVSPDSSQSVQTANSLKKNNFKFIFIISILAALSIIIFFIYSFSSSYFKHLYGSKSAPPSSSKKPSQKTDVKTETSKITTFESAKDFIAYLEKAEENQPGRSFGPVGMGMAKDSALGAPVPETGGGGGGPQRISETNVQVKGIDEPDVVKTDGEEIYFSPLKMGYRLPSVPLFESARGSYFEGKTKVIKAFPPKEMKIKKEIEKSGNLLLSDDTLIIFSQDYIYGYDISDSLNPKEVWKMEITSKNAVVNSRLYDGRLYLITRTQISKESPCPIRPLTVNGNQISVECNRIYHPQEPVFTDSTYNVFKVNPENGQVDQKISFVGTQTNSTVYMSKNSVYVTYKIFPDMIKILADFFSSEGKSLVSQNFLEQIKKLQQIDISNQAKMTEFNVILSDYRSSLTEDEELKFENEMENAMSDYLEEHGREMETTGLVRVSVPELEFKSSGVVPGSPLNQFSLDEYQNHLRIATTINENYFLFGSAKSVNDLYILDNNLDITGEIKDLGITERIYSARFIEDKGYLVTFRRIDPFYVFDLSDPFNPEKKGELKIPGYSSYLHPIDKNTILGIGEEDNKVKLSLFDVSDPETPQEKDKYQLDEYWTEVNSNHHAFLMDSKHQIFFLPATKGGYVFSYQGNVLKLEKAISERQVKRALYLDDYLYIIGEEELVVLDENNWEEVNKIEF